MEGQIENRRAVARPRLRITIGYNQWRLLKTLLSTVTKRNSEDKTLYLLVNQPLVIAAVVRSLYSPNLVKRTVLKLKSEYQQVQESEV